MGYQWAIIIRNFFLLICRVNNDDSNVLIHLQEYHASIVSYAHLFTFCMASSGGNDMLRNSSSSSLLEVRPDVPPPTCTSPLVSYQRYFTTDAYTHSCSLMFLQSKLVCYTLLSLLKTAAAFANCVFISLSVSSSFAITLPVCPILIFYTHHKLN